MEHNLNDEHISEMILNAQLLASGYTPDEIENLSLKDLELFLIGKKIEYMKLAESVAEGVCIAFNGKKGKGKQNKYSN